MTNVEHGGNNSATLASLQRCRNMSSVNQRNQPPPWGKKSNPEVVALPRPHEGVRRALLGSFGAVPAMPQEFVRLLERIR
jgi:hypothetical protein